MKSQGHAVGNIYFKRHTITLKCETIAIIKFFIRRINSLNLNMNFNHYYPCLKYRQSVVQEICNFKSVIECCPF